MNASQFYFYEAGVPESRGPRCARFLRVVGWKPGSPLRAVFARSGVETGMETGVAGFGAFFSSPFNGSVWP
jgi:hypothetical protein